MHVMTTVERAVFPDGFSLRQFTSVMIAGLNRSVARANNGSKGPKCKIDDDEWQQSAMGTQKGAAMRSRHSTALQETARFTVHCMGGDYIVAARSHHSCHITSQLMYMHSTIIPDSPPSRRPNVLKY